MQGVLDGEMNAYRDVVLMNAGAGLLIADMADSLEEGAQLAAQAIDDGRANETLTKLIATSQAESA